MADSVTVLQDAGPGKKTLAILGDGYTAADQGTYNTYVNDMVFKGVFGNDYYNEDAAAWNIRRVNLESVDSGVTERTWNLMGTPSNLTDDTSTDVARNSALSIIANGEWWHNWFENGTNTQSRIDAAVAKWAPGADFILIVVNSGLGGGLRSGNVLKITRVEGSATIRHEMGHGFGNLADEYSAAGKGAFTASDPGRVNVTKETKRASLKWRQFVDSSTPIPTGTGAAAGFTAAPKPAGWSDSGDAGLFEGGHTFETGIFRPVIDCRMNSNSPDFCPICYTELKRAYYSTASHSFAKTVPGRYLDTKQPSVLQADARALTFHRPSGNGWEHAKTTATIVPGSWEIRPGDQYWAGDFDGDGRDELLVYNSSDWVMPYLAVIKVAPTGETQVVRRYDGDIPGWDGFRGGDKFLVGDLTGDGKDDVVIYNTTDWNMPYVATLISNGSGLTLSRRYDGDIPGWGGLARHDLFYLADVAGTGANDLLIWNAEDWSNDYLGLFRMQRGSFRIIQMYDNDIPGWGGFARHDRFYVGDFNGDGKQDLFIFNGSDWSKPYLGMFRSNGSGFVVQHLYEDDVPGWGGMREHDQFLPVDLTGSGKVGLFAWNVQDWGHTYAGRMVSNGTTLAADFREDWVGEWRVSGADQYQAIPGVITGPIFTPGRARLRARDLARLSVRDRARLELDNGPIIPVGPGNGPVITIPGDGPIGGPIRGGVHSLFTTGPQRVLSHNAEWLGTFDTHHPLTLDRIYYHWVHNYRFGRNW